jgi:hypothetical protein
VAYELKKKAPAGVNAASLRLSSEDPQGLSGFRERKGGVRETR